jgi:hypothetical protein
MTIQTLVFFSLLNTGKAGLYVPFGTGAFLHEGPARADKEITEN